MILNNLEGMQAMPRRGIELSVQSANGTYNDSHRKYPPIDTSVTIKGEMPSFIHPRSSVSAGYTDKVYTTTEKYKEGGAETDYTIRHSASILDFDAFRGLEEKEDCQISRPKIYCRKYYAISVISFDCLMVPKKWETTDKYRVSHFLES